jgi:DNA polymerase III alpha subunit
MDKAVQTPPFVHLRVHSEFSVVDGMLRIPDLISRSVSQGQPAVALTDLSNVFGLIKFYKAARGAGSLMTKTAKNRIVCYFWFQTKLGIWPCANF